MAKTQSIAELLRATQHDSTPATRDSLMRQSLDAVSVTSGADTPGGQTQSQPQALTSSLPGVVVTSSGSGAPAAESAGAAPSSSGGSNLPNQLQQISTLLTQLQATNQSAIDSTAQNTQALLQNTQTKSQSGGGSTLGTIGNTLLSVFSGGLSPIITGIASLFGGGDSSTPPPLTPYVLPQSIDLRAGISGPGRQVTTVDQNSNGQLRPVTSNTQPAPQVTVQVQAIDSKSFLDHSTDIANAVRQALLNGSSLSDVISEL